MVVVPFAPASRRGFFVCASRCLVGALAAGLPLEWRLPPVNKGFSTRRAAMFRIVEGPARRSASHIIRAAPPWFRESTGPPSGSPVSGEQQNLPKTRRFRIKVLHEASRRL
ncbi:hypothetical protein [Burkholderia gladioli]|uniref:hypothetical protein n=1 Tax=Burkholderia gladioli TaxID=28095 RepID=UPI0016420087|nr:hypothetical protein [Burkholderia gladioli]